MGQLGAWDGSLSTLGCLTRKKGRAAMRMTLRWPRDGFRHHGFDPIETRILPEEWPAAGSCGCSLPPRILPCPDPLVCYLLRLSGGDTCLDVTLFEARNRGIHPLEGEADANGTHKSCCAIFSGRMSKVSGPLSLSLSSLCSMFDSATAARVRMHSA